VVAVDANSPLSDSSCNTCCNSYANSVLKSLSITERRIFKLLTKSAIPISPNQIYHDLNMEEGKKPVAYGTIRSLLRRMKARGVVKQPEGTYTYCDKLTYDVRIRPLAVHNLRLHFDAGESLEHWEVTEQFGEVKVYVCFGSERGLVSGRISCDRGMNRDACMLALDKWTDMAEKHLGREVKDIVLTVCEVNRDSPGIKLDGSLHCATRQVLKNVLERVYEKEDGLRQEFRIQKNFTIAQFDEMFTKTLDGVLGDTANYDSEEKLSGIEQTQKFANRRLLDMQGSIQAIEKKIISQSSNSEDVDKLLSDLREANARQVDFMQKQQDKSSLELEQYKKLFLDQSAMTMQLQKMVGDLVKALGVATQTQPQQEQKATTPSEVHVQPIPYSV